MASIARSLVALTLPLMTLAACARHEKVEHPTPASAATPESDEHAAGILAKGCDKLIADSVVALNLAVKPEVRALAQDVRDSCRAYNDDQVALLSRFGTSEAATPLGKRLEALTMADTSTLAANEPSDFDRAFLLQLIGDMGAFAVIIEARVMPLVHRSELDALLRAELMPALEKHFAETRRLIEGR
jgi:hypothetical protein